MADGSCSSRSCVVKKKLYKRELQKWAKNVLYLVGLERVAREVVGHKKWKRLCVPIADAVDDKASQEIVDWTPDEKCIFCLNRLDVSDVGSIDGASNDEGSDRAGSPLSIASDEPLDLSMASSKARQHNHSSGGMNGTSAGSVLKVPRIPEKSGRHPRRRCGLDVDTSPTIPSHVHASPSPNTNNTDGSVAAATANATALAKRVYTDDELQLALRDIQDGKLGTRRASILYGIPRSTLRNKVYKMTMDRPDESPPSGDRTDDSRRPSPVPQQQGRSLTTNDVVTVEQPHSRLSASESLKRLLRNRMAERLENRKAAAASATATDGRLKFPLLPDLIRKLSKERFEQECSRSREGGAVDNFILKIPSYKPAKSMSNSSDITAASSQPSSGKGRAVRHVNSTESNNRRRSRDKTIGAALRDIVAKSIAHRAASSAAAEETPDVKRGQRIPSRSSSFDVGAKKKLPDGPSTSSTRTGGGSAVVQNETSAATATKASRKSCGKRMRAKRGRYRNYDRDNLMEAVRAVRRGEMSVHRAGSIYGVPHSTLEYKVKERHLMRPKKRRSGSAATSSKKASNADHRSSPPSSSKSSFVDSSGTYSGDDDEEGDEDDDEGGGSTYDESNSRESMLQDKASPAEVLPVGRGRRCRPSASLSSVASASTPTAAAADASTAPLWPFALDFSNLNSSNFFASQMMRKLQEDAMMHAAAAGKRSSPAAAPPLTTTTTNGTDSGRDALLLSVLIRNGLQIQNPDAASSGRK